MKMILVSAALLLSLKANALIQSSALEFRHQEAIVQAVKAHCGIYQELTQISYEENIVKVDSGITDLYFDIMLESKDSLYPMHYSQFDISVKSVLSDMYDHNTGNWGAYSVLDVVCVQK